jgi:phosphate acyltransferase
MAANKKVRVCVDIMGGDHAPDVVLEGSAEALALDEDLSLVVTGPAEIVEPFARRFPDRVEAVPTTEVIAMHEHPAEAVRAKKDSSIVVGCRLVAKGHADAFFSAGSTGACLTAATLIIGRLRGVKRSALATVVPSPIRPIVLTDVGANADCPASYLVQFAEMGRLYSRCLLGTTDPSIALLNIGEEDTKGSQLAQEAHELMRAQVPGFKGNAEGNDILQATYDVIVTDGFTGNVALKTIEGTSRVLFGAIKQIMTSSLGNKLAAAQLKPAFNGLKEQVSSDTYGGAPLLGLKNVVIIGHGSSSSLAIRNGILTTARAVRLDLPRLIGEAIAAQSSATSSADASATADLLDARDDG